MAPKFSSLLLLYTALSLLVAATPSCSQSLPPLVKGLSYDFYAKSCPQLECIVSDQIQSALKKDIGLAAALLRIHFHDCFVQGCDGSVLLDSIPGAAGEKEARPNRTLRSAAFALINSIRSAVEKACGRVVSCADITTLATRDSVFLSGGPRYPVPLGRRDGLTFASESTVLDFLPPPSGNTSRLITAFARLNLDQTDLVALSGGHTIGIAHCPAFTGRLYPVQDPTMDKTFASNLRLTCPTSNTDNSTFNDIRSPNVFDNKYYVDLMNRQGLFTSDQDLYSDSRTRSTVTAFAVNQTLFFEKFAYSIIKMGMLNVLTGTQGQIRANCSVRNPTSAELETVVNRNGKRTSTAAAAAA